MLTHLGRYFYAELECGKHAVLVVVKPKGLQIIVQNEQHRVWRGLGKEFATLEAAVANYRTPAIREMIAEAVRLAQPAAKEAA